MMAKSKGTTYKDAGVDIDLGDDASIILYNAAKATWANRISRIGEILVPADNFAAVRSIDISGLPKGSILGMNSDGVGTKMEIAERLGDHTTIAFDLFAMVCDDAAIRGAEPILIATVLDVNSLGRNEKTHIDAIRQLAKGYVLAAQDAGVAVINGELAELGGRVGGYGDFNYNWGATVTWVARKDRLITGDRIRKGDTIVGLREKGFRSNGLSLVRKILENTYGAEWHTDKKGKKLAHQVLTPSQIYTRLLMAITGGFRDEPRAQISAAAHITGGGLPGKLRRIIEPMGFGAIIVDPFEPAQAMLHLQEKGQVTDKDAYRAWNMGQGMVIITPEPEAVIKIAQEFAIEARKIGELTDTSQVSIVSKGYEKAGSLLVF